MLCALYDGWKRNFYTDLGLRGHDLVMLSQGCLLKIQVGFAALLFFFLPILVSVSTVGVVVEWGLSRGCWRCTKHQDSSRVSALRVGEMF